MAGSSGLRPMPRRITVREGFPISAPHFVKEIKEFFVTYNKLRDRKFQAKGDGGRESA